MGSTSFDQEPASISRSAWALDFGPPNKISFDGSVVSGLTHRDSRSRSAQDGWISISRAVSARFFQTRPPVNSYLMRCPVEKRSV